MSVCVGAVAYAHGSMCMGGQRSTAGVFLCHSPSCSLRQGLFGLELDKQVRLAVQQAPGIHLSLSPQHWDYNSRPPHRAFLFLWS